VVGRRDPTLTAQLADPGDEDDPNEPDDDDAREAGAGLGQPTRWFAAVAGGLLWVGIGRGDVSVDGGVGVDRVGR